MTELDARHRRRTDAGYVVQFERRLHHPRERVWRALTESEHLAHWMPCDIVGERRAGVPIELPFWPAHVERYGIETPSLTGTIAVWDPPAVFEWWWDTDRLRWELDEVDDGTLLRFTTWLGPDGKGAANAAAGYHLCLDSLVALLDTGAAPPLVDADTAPWERRYGAAVAATQRGRLARRADAPPSGERTDRLAIADGFTVEQILSGELAAPQAYEQDHDEWVLLVEGAAVLEVDGTEHELDAGDWCLLPAGTPHRLVRTEPGTSWLAVRSVVAVDRMTVAADWNMPPIACVSDVVTPSTCAAASPRT